MIRPRPMPSAILTLAVTAWCVLPARGEVMLDAQWAAAEPAAPPVWCSRPDQAAVSGGMLSVAISTNSMKLWTYFAPDGGEVALAPGEKLVATLEITLGGALYDQSSRGFRVGLYNDPSDPQVRENVNDDGGGDGDPWADAAGYAVELALSSGLTQLPNPIQLFKRVNANPSLLGSGGAMASASSGGRAAPLALDTPYTLTFEVACVSTSRVDLTVTLANPDGVLSTQTVRDDGRTFGPGTLPDSQAPYTTFEQLFVRTTSRDTSADIIHVSRIRVEHGSGPAER